MIEGLEPVRDPRIQGHLTVETQAWRDGAFQKGYGMLLLRTFQ